MANTSILAAFDRMWQHVIAAINSAVAQKSQVQIIIWEEDD